MKPILHGGAAAICIAVAILYLGYSGGGGTVSAGMAVGAVMPDFTLKDYNGQDHTLAQYKGQVLVLEFCSQECPFSRGADPGVEALATAYAGKGAVFLGIDSHKDTTPAQIKQYTGEKKLAHLILKDTGNQYADAVGASRTPEFYVVDKDGKLAYHGALDNRAGPESKGTEHYVKDAVDALLSGKPVAKPEVKSWGCGIKRK